MAISVRSSSLGTKNASGAVTVAKPAGASIGDLLVAFHSADQFGMVIAMTGPTGFGQQGTTYTAGMSGSGSCHGKVWSKVVDGSESTSFSLGNSDTSAVGMLCVTGQDTTTPFAVTVTWGSGSSSTTSQPAPSVTPPVDNGLLVCWFSTTYNSGTPGYTPPPGMTEQQDAGTAAGFTTACLDTQILVGGSGVATGTKTATLSVSTVNEPTNCTLVIAPLASAAALPQVPYVSRQAVHRASLW